jgi:hypothetical protein
MWTSNNIPTAALIQALKARYGLLWNMKLAMRYRRPYLTGKNRSIPFTKNATCPLCPQEDSTGHILGGCQHPTMHAHYISRHDGAVRSIHKGVQRGTLGGCYTIMDAGTMEATLALAANGKRVPQFVLPDVDADTLQRMRPDILLIENLPATATIEEIENAASNKVDHRIHLIEVGYGPDTRWRDTLTMKQQQHQRLRDALAAAGWTVTEHIFVLGSQGTVYNNTLKELKSLGLETAMATQVMRKLHIHAVLSLWSIVKTRRHLERALLFGRSCSGDSPPRTGEG